MPPLDPDLVKALGKMMRADLNSWSSLWFWALVASTVLVVIGIIGEAPEVLEAVGFGDKTISRIRRFWYIRVRRVEFGGWERLCPELIDSNPRHRKWIAKVALVSWVLIAVGVAGEGFAEYFVNDAESEIKAFDNAELIETQSSANSAAAASSLAFSFSDKSEKASSNALVLATGARKEADSFEGDIRVAKTQAAEAESHLADALQRAANAEAELHRLKLSRSLVRSENLIAALKPFSGTEYRFNVFADDESIQFTKAVALALHAAGWIRKQPTSAALGIPTLEVFFDQGVAEHVPTCIETGVSLHAYAKESLATLRVIPFQSLPKTVLAAMALNSAIAQSISPADERNVVTGIVDPTSSEGVPMTICVGKKP